MRTFESEPIADRDAALEQADGGSEAVAEVGLGRRAHTHRRAVRGEQVELRVVGVRRMHDRRPLGQAARSVRGARSAAGRARRCTPRSREAARRRGRGAAGPRAPRSAPISSSQSAGQARTEWGATPTAIPSARSASTSSRNAATDGWRKRSSAAARVGDVQQDEARSRPRRPPPPRPRLAQRRCSGTRRRRCTPPPASRDRSRHTPPGRGRASAARPPRACRPATPRSRLRPRGRAARAGTCGCARSRSRAAASSRPRAATLHERARGASAQSIRSGMSDGIGVRHGASDPERPHDRPLRGDPGLRRRCSSRAGDDAAWGAGFLFGGAAITDQLDGWLARRWHVESQFGRIADPLADRLMISVAAVLLWHDGRLPWPAALIVLSRDLFSSSATSSSPRGRDGRRDEARQGRHMDPLPGTRDADRHRQGDGLAALDLLARPRARARRGGAVHGTARRTIAG